MCKEFSRLLRFFFFLPRNILLIYLYLYFMFVFLIKVDKKLNQTFP